MTLEELLESPSVEIADTSVKKLTGLRISRRGLEPIYEVVKSYPWNNIEQRVRGGLAILRLYTPLIEASLRRYGRKVTTNWWPTVKVVDSLGSFGGAYAFEPKGKRRHCIDLRSLMEEGKTIPYNVIIRVENFMNRYKELPWQIKGEMIRLIAEEKIPQEIYTMPNLIQQSSPEVRAKAELKRYADILRELSRYKLCNLHDDMILPHEGVHIACHEYVKEAAERGELLQEEILTDEITRDVHYLRTLLDPDFKGFLSEEKDRLYPYLRRKYSHRHK